MHTYAWLVKYQIHSIGSATDLHGFHCTILFTVQSTDQCKGGCQSLRLRSTHCRYWKHRYCYIQERVMFRTFYAPNPERIKRARIMCSCYIPLCNLQLHFPCLAATSPKEDGLCRTTPVLYRNPTLGRHEALGKLTAAVSSRYTAITIIRHPYSNLLYTFPCLEATSPREDGPGRTTLVLYRNLVLRAATKHLGRNHCRSQAFHSMAGQSSFLDSTSVVLTV